MFADMLFYLNQLYFLFYFFHSLEILLYFSNCWVTLLTTHSDLILILFPNPNCIHRIFFLFPWTDLRLNTLAYAMGNKNLFPCSIMNEWNPQFQSFTNPHKLPPSTLSLTSSPIQRSTSCYKESWFSLSLDYWVFNILVICLSVHPSELTGLIFFFLLI